jgi:hypothetical protein
LAGGAKTKIGTYKHPWLFPPQNQDKIKNKIHMYSAQGWEKKMAYIRGMAISHIMTSNNPCTSGTKKPHIFQEFCSLLFLQSRKPQTHSSPPVYRHFKVRDRNQSVTLKTKVMDKQILS